MRRMTKTIAFLLAGVLTLNSLYCTAGAEEVVEIIKDELIEIENENVFEPYTEIIDEMYEKEAVAYTESVGDYIASGHIDTIYPAGIDWSIDTNGYLLVTGEGDYSDDSTNFYDTPSWVKWGDGNGHINDKTPYIKKAKISIKNATSMKRLFCGCNKLEEVDLSESDFSLVEDCQRMFECCSSLTNVVFPSGKLSPVNVGSMFYKCESLKKIDLSMIDLSNLKDASHMFDRCTNLEKIKFGNQRLDSLQDIAAMFINCSALQDVDVSNFNTSNVQYAFHCFEGCSSLTRIDLRTWDLGNIIRKPGYQSYAVHMFDDCTSLEVIIAPLNLQVSDANLPSGKWYLSSGEKVTRLPCNLSNSRVIAKNRVPDDNEMTMEKLRLISKSPVEDVCCSTSVIPTLFFNKPIRIKSTELISIKNITDNTDVRISLELSSNKNILKINPSDGLEKGKSYRITLLNGAIESEDNCIYTGTEWEFETEVIHVLESSKYVELSYAKKSNKYLWLIKEDDEKKPAIPKVNQSDINYGKELKYWASKYDITDISNLSDRDAAKLVSMSAEFPMITEDKEVIFTKNENTIRTLMSDAIFISEMQKWLNPLDGDLYSICSGIEDGTMTNIYRKYEDGIDQSNKYLKERTNGKSSDFNLTILTPYLVSNRLSKITDPADLIFKGMEYHNVEKDLLNGYKFQTPYLTLKSETNIADELYDISKSETYYDFIENTKLLQKNLKEGKKLYKAFKEGLWGGFKYFGKTFLDEELRDKYPTLDMICDTYEFISEFQKPLKFALLGGANTMALGSYVIEMHQNFMKKIEDNQKAWYFWTNYYIQFKYPNIYEFCFDDNLNINESLLTGTRDGGELFGVLLNMDGSSKAIQEYNYAYQNDCIFREWLKYMDAKIFDSEAGGLGYSISSANYYNCIIASREIPNLAYLYGEIQTVDADEMKLNIVKLASAKKNEGIKSIVNVSCPVLVKLYDNDMNFVTSLSSDLTTGIDDAGYYSTYLFGDNNETKCFVIDNDKYYFEIVPYDDGVMDIEIYSYDGIELINYECYENIAIENDKKYDLMVSNGNSELTNPLGEVVNQTVTDDVDAIDIIIENNELFVGQSLILDVIIYPLYTSNQEIEFECNNNNVTVSSNGTVVAKTPGNSIITVKSKINPAIKGQIEITVKSPIEDIEFSDEVIDVIKGTSIDLSPCIMPESYDEDIIWGTYDSSIAQIDNGTVYGENEGTTFIYCSSMHIEKELCVRVVGEHTGKYSLLFNGGASAMGNPPSEICAYESESVTLPDNPFVLDGKKFVGWNDGERVYCPGEQYTVPNHHVIFNAVWENVNVAVDSILLTKSDMELKKGESELLLTTIIPKNATNKKVFWFSNNDGVVSVDQWGRITALDVGSANVAVKTEDGGKTAVCIVNVINNDEDNDKNPTPIPTWKPTIEKLSSSEYVLNLASKEKYTVSELKRTKRDGNRYKITYDSSDSGNIASMTESGIITAKKSGVSKIFISKGDEKYTVTVNVYNPKFVYDNPKIKQFKTNKGDKIIPKYDNKGLKPRFSIDSNSRKKGIATIDPDTGELTALKRGVVTVTATVGEGKNARKVSTKVAIYNPKIYVKNSKVKVGKTITLTIKNGVSKPATEWSIKSGPAVISSKGKLRGTAPGTVIVEAKNNGRVMTKEITIVE